MADRRRTAATGAQRDARAGKGRYDLASPFPAARKAKIFERGAEHYGDRNWEQGMPLSWFLDSTERHIVQAKMGMTDEDHWGAASWNLDALMHTQEMIDRGILPAELNDLPNYIGIAGIADRTPAQCAAEIGLPASTSSPLKHNIYVAGPFTAMSDAARRDNISRASTIGWQLMRKGHRAHVPHAATCRWHGRLGREPIMDLDLSIIDAWASALFYMAPSLGADVELARAEENGLVIFRSLEEVPDLRNIHTQREWR